MAPPLVALLVFADPSTAPAGSSMPPRRHVVKISGMAFQPAVLQVAPGDTVVWINQDIVPHTASAAGSDGWDTGILVQGDSSRYVPRRSGDTPYICRLHPTMRGGLTVTGRPR
ncbi:MAG TPA: cupredoxin family copper-binding protein [Gemmatimonadales bacterium]